MPTAYLRYRDISINSNECISGVIKSGSNRDSIRADTETESWIKILCKEKECSVCVCVDVYISWSEEVLLSETVWDLILLEH